jgi:peptidoglycan/xylan/chitin deacetylase (PgdA/CDA1 family)
MKSLLFTTASSLVLYTPGCMSDLSFRFDVDTHKCVLEGVPNLLKLARKHRVKFTFFVHVGRSISRKYFLRDKIFPTPRQNHKNISAVKKLGLKDYLITACLNPEIGSLGRDIIARCVKEGHEVCLHGGRNHEVWNQEVQAWSPDRVNNEIVWGLDFLADILPKYKIIGFASPNWKSHDVLHEILRKNSFLYVSDIHTNHPKQRVGARVGLHNIPVNISGEPGGVGYLEWCRASGLTDREILNDFADKLSKRKIFATVYDHPYYSGVYETKMLSKMINLAKGKKFKIVTMSKLLNLT